MRTPSYPRKEVSTRMAHEQDPGENYPRGTDDDVAPADLALQEAARHLFELPERPRERALRQMATAWSPWRSVAARLLFAYYRAIKQREGIS